MRRILAICIIFLPLFCCAVHAQGDLVICVDASGSMRFEFLPGGVDAPGTCSDMVAVAPDPGGTHPLTTRYGQVYEALSDITSTLLAEMANNGSIGEVHVVRFPNYGSAAPLTSTATCTNPFEASSLCDDIYDFLPNNLSIECVFGTPLENGLIAANGLLNTGLCTATSGTPSAGTADPDRMILLICDGQPTDGLNATTLDASLGANVCDNVQINAIGIGNYSNADYFNLLYQIAFKRRGEFFGYLPTGGIAGTWGGGTAVDDFTSKAQIISGLESLFMGTLGYSAIVDPAGQLSSGEHKDFEFLVTPLDTALVFAVHYGEVQEQSISAKIVLPDNQEVTESSPSSPGNFTIARANRSTYFLFYNNFIKSHHGQWQLRLQADAAIQQSASYFFSVYTRSGISVSTEFADSVFATGDYFSGQTSVQFQNELIRDINANVSYKAPRNWRGNWNADQKLTEEELEIVQQGLPISGREISPWAKDTPLADRKLAYLQRYKGLSFTELFDEQISLDTLYDDGRHADGQDDDGVFNNQFLELRTPGLYQVLYRINGKTKDGESFGRELFFHSYVDVQVESNWDNSEIEFISLPGVEAMAAVQVEVRFKDKFDNVPLPGKSEMIKIIPDQGSLRGSLVDRLDGTYTQDILYTPSQGKPNIQVNYGEVEFPRRKVVYDPRWDIVLQTGKLLIDGDFSLSNPLIVGLTANWYVSDRWSLEGTFGIGWPKDSFGMEGSVYLSAMNARLLVLQDVSLSPFVAAGASYLRFRDLTTDDDAYAVDFGAGLDWKLSDRWGLQLEAKDHIAFDLYGKDISHNFFLVGGISLFFY